MRNRPGIFQVGQVTDDGHTVRVTGWGIGRCITNCPCHVSPDDHAPHIYEDNVRGRLGLRCYRADGCTCCEPWYHRELAAIVADFAAIEALDEVPS